MEDLFRMMLKRQDLELELIPVRLSIYIKLKFGKLDGKQRSDCEAAKFLGIPEKEFKARLIEAYKKVRELQGVLPLPELETGALSRIFISYCWEEEKHNDWVMMLASRLSIAGFDVRFDRWDIKAGWSATHYMEESISLSDFVVCVFTPKYANKANERQQASGTGYEQQIISGELMSGVDRQKFLPILRSGSRLIGDYCAIPRHFMGIAYIDFRQDEKFEHSFEELVRTLTQNPKYKRPVSYNQSGM